MFQFFGGSVRRLLVGCGFSVVCLCFWSDFRGFTKVPCFVVLALCLRYWSGMFSFFFFCGIEWYVFVCGVLWCVFAVLWSVLVVLSRDMLEKTQRTRNIHTCSHYTQHTQHTHHTTQHTQHTHAHTSYTTSNTQQHTHATMNKQQQH